MPPHITFGIQYRISILNLSKGKHKPRFLEKERMKPQFIRLEQTNQKNLISESCP